MHCSDLMNKDEDNNSIRPSSDLSEGGRSDGIMVGDDGEFILDLCDICG